MIKSIKKAFTASVVASTMLWSVGASLVVPMAASADSVCPTLAAGDMIKVSGKPAIYAVNKDLEVMYFPTGDEFKSWNADEKYSGYYTTVSQECYDSLPLPSTYPGGVGFAPGSYLIKRGSSDQLYVVEPDYTKAKIDAAAAEALYGADYLNKVKTVGDAFWPNYVNNGTEISGASAKPHEGMKIEVDGTKYYVGSGDTLHELTATGMTANRVKEAFIVELSASAISGMTTGDAISAEDTSVSDRTQGLSSGGSTTTEETTTQSGDVTVSLSANTPDASNVVISIDNVVFGKFMLRAGDEDAVVNSVKIGRKGLGATGDFTNVTLYDGDTKLGSTKTSWHSDGYMTYNISGGWAIPAGTSKELTVVAKLGTANTYNSLGILDLGLGGGSVSGLPVYGNEMKGVSVTVGTVTVTGQGSNATKNIGTSDVTLGKFKLTLSAIEDAKLQKITLKNKAASNNAADSDVGNVELYYGSTKLAGPVSMVSDKITFVLDEPFAIEKSKNETFTIKGDILDGNAHTVEYVLEYDTDIKIVGDTYGTDLTVVRTGFDAVADSGTALITIAGAELNVSFSSSNTDTRDEVTDYEFGRLTLSSGSTDIKITSMILGITETDGNSDSAVDDIDEFELVDASSGSAYSGTESTGADHNATAETWTFSDEIYLSAGESRTFIARGDIPAATSTGNNTGDSYKVTMTVNTTNLVAETVPAGDSVSNFSIGSFTGKTATVKAPTLVIVATDMNAGTAVVNDPDVIIFKGELQASGDDIRVERLRFEGGHATAGNVTYTEANLDTLNWTDLGLYTVAANGEYVLQQNITSGNMTSGEADFDTLDFSVPNGGTVNIVLKGTIASTITASTTVHVQLDTVTAKDTDNDTATVTDIAATAIASGAELETTRTVTLAAKGVLYVSMLDNDAGFNKDRVVLAGSSFWAGKLRMRALYEDIKVKDLKLTNTNTGTEDEVSSVCLYKAQSATADNLIGCTNVSTADIAFFDDIDEVVTQGTHYWYIYVNTNNMGIGATATADTQNTAAEAIQYKITTTSGHLTAEGVDSGEALAYGNFNSAVAAGEIVFDKNLNGTFDEASDTETSESKDFYVAGSKITGVELVSSYGGETISSAINGNGTYTFAILKIQTASNVNTDSNGDALKLTLSQLRFDMSKNASTTLNSVTVQRIGGATAAQTMTFASSTDTAGSTSDDWYLANATSSLTTDALIESGEAAYFVVKGTINALSTASNITNYVQVGLDDLKGTAGAADANNNIDWLDGYATDQDIAEDFDFLLLDTESITGTRVAAPLNN